MAVVFASVSWDGREEGIRAPRLGLPGSAFADTATTAP